MPAVKFFIDTNVFLYARQQPRDDKAERAEHWLRVLVDGGIAHTSLQVLNEMAHVLLRKRADMSTADVFAACDALAPLGTTPVTMEIYRRARAIRLRTHYAWWDCLLLASALELGCTHFLSEDLQDGHKVDGLTIVSPFAHSPTDIL